MFRCYYAAVTPRPNNYHVSPPSGEWKISKFNARPVRIIVGIADAILR